MRNHTIFTDCAPIAPDRYGRYSVCLEQLARVGIHPRNILQIRSERGTITRVVQIRSNDDLYALMMGMRAEQWPEPE